MKTNHNLYLLGALSALGLSVAQGAQDSKNFGGFRLGAHMGLANSHVNYLDLDGGFGHGNGSIRSGLAGANLTFDKMFGTFLMGALVEANYYFGDDNDAKNGNVAGSNFHTITYKLSHGSLLGARFGYTPSANFLIYTHIGLESVKTSFTYSALQSAGIFIVAGDKNAFDAYIHSPYLGLGVEYAFSPKISLKLDFRFATSERRQTDIRTTATDKGFTVKPERQTLCVGLTYRL